MATPRRVNLTGLPQPAPLHAVGTDLPHPAGLKSPPAPSQAERTLSARVEVVLFEPDDARCAEFHYPELTAVKQNTNEVQPPAVCLTRDPFSCPL